MPGSGDAARARQVRRPRRARHAVDPGSDVEQFVSEELGLTSFKASYQPRLASWAVSGDKASAASTSTYGTTRRNAVELMGDSLNGSTPKVFDTFRNADGSTYSVLNTQETQAAQDKQAEIKAKFEDWLLPRRRAGRAPAQGLQRALQQLRRAGVERRLSDHPGRHRLVVVAPAPEARDRPHHPERQHLPRPRGGRRQDRDDDRREHGDAPPRPRQQADDRGPQPHARPVHEGVLRALSAGEAGGRRRREFPHRQAQAVRLRRRLERPRRSSSRTLRSASFR
jgi:hypothetical protein